MQKYDTHSSCGNIYFGKNYHYFGFAENQSVVLQPLLQEAVGNVAVGI
jgi:hypothetical protein